MEQPQQKGTTVTYKHDTARRNTDPITSHDAALAVTESGLRRTQAETLLEAVKAMPGGTVAEYARITPLDKHQITRRMADLHNKGEVYPEGERKIDGYNQRTWWVGVDPNGTEQRAHCSTCHCFYQAETIPEGQIGLGI